MSWGKEEGLYVYYNGEKEKFTKEKTESIRTSTKNNLIMGGKGVKVEVDYYQIAAWNSYTFESNAAHLMGLQPLQGVLFRNDYYWPFDGIVEDLNLGRVAPVLHNGARFVRDQAITGRAIRATRKRHEWVSLGDHLGGCIVDPIVCRKLLVISFNVKLTKAQAGTLLSSGAQIPSE